MSTTILTAYGESLLLPAYISSSSQYEYCVAHAHALHRAKKAGPSWRCSYLRAMSSAHPSPASIRCFSRITAPNQIYGSTTIRPTRPGSSQGLHAPVPAQIQGFQGRTAARRMVRQASRPPEAGRPCQGRLHALHRRRHDPQAGFHRQGDVPRRKIQCRSGDRVCPPSHAQLCGGFRRAFDLSSDHARFAPVSHLRHKISTHEPCDRALHAFPAIVLRKNRRVRKK